MYRKQTKRAFRGIAGSPLATIVEQASQQSDFTVRVPKTPEQEDPTVLDPLTVWIDQFGQEHGAIDEDCAFQTCAFDPVLRGARPEGTGHIRSGPNRLAGVPWDATDLNVPLKNRRRGYGIGLLEGDREIRKRRTTPGTKWIFDSETFRAYLFDVRDRKGVDAAVKVADVLYQFYYCNREDLDIWYKFHFRYWDTANAPSVQQMMDEEAPEPFEIKGAKEVKSYRQYHLNCGQKFSGFGQPKSPARRVLVAHYSYEGHGYEGEFNEGVITGADAMLGAYIGELSERRRKQGFEIQIKLAHTIDRLFPSYKKALDYMRSIEMNPVTCDQLAELIVQPSAA